MKYSSIHNNIKYHFRKKRNYRIQVKSEYLQSYHAFSHNKMKSILSYCLGIDDYGIEVYYVYSMRHGIVFYV